MELDAVRVVFFGDTVVTVSAFFTVKLPLAVRPNESDAETLTDMLVPVSPAVVNHESVGVTVTESDVAVIVWMVVEPFLNTSDTDCPDRFVKEIVTLLPTPTVLGAMLMENCW